MRARVQIFAVMTVLLILTVWNLSGGSTVSSAMAPNAEDNAADGLADVTSDTLPEGKILGLDKALLQKAGIQILNISALTAVLVFLLYKPVRKYLGDRRQKISDELDEANRVRDEALALKTKYENLITELETEREEILRKVHRQAVEKSDQILFEARRDAEVVYERARAELDLERENLSGEMKRQIIEIAHMMAGRFIAVSIDRGTQDEMFESALTEWNRGDIARY